MVNLLIDKFKIKKILIIKLRGIGDVVLSTIVLDNLKIDFPNSKIDYLTDAPSIPGLAGLKQVNKVWEFPKVGLLKRLELFWSIRKQKYDMVLDFFTNPTTAQITFISGARLRVGFPYKGRKYAYNNFGPGERSKFHSSVLHLMTLRNLGITFNEQKLYYYIDNTSYVISNKYFKDNDLIDKFVVGISPSGGWASKKCDPEIFAKIANNIAKRYNAKILILWGKSDEEDARLIYDLVADSYIAPPTSIREMAAFISSCSVLVSNDSGPMHISTAVDTPVLSLHGPTDPRLQGPFGDKHEWINYEELDCIICNLLNCPKHHECFLELPFDRIMNKFELLITKNNLLNK